MVTKLYSGRGVGIGTKLGLNARASQAALAGAVIPLRFILMGCFVVLRFDKNADFIIAFWAAGSYLFLRAFSLQIFGRMLVGPLIVLGLGK